MAEEKEAALRPTALKNSSAGSDEKPYELAPIDDVGRQLHELDDTRRLLIEALKLPEAKKTLEEERPATKLDQKIAERKTRGRPADELLNEAKANDAVGEVELKMKQVEDNKVFTDFWAQQAERKDLPGIDVPEETLDELKAGFESPLGNGDPLALHFQVEAARSEVAKEEGAPTTSKIAKIREFLPGVDIPQGLFYKALGYLEYAVQIGCNKDTIENLRYIISQNQDNSSELKLVILKTLELIEEAAKAEEKRDKNREKIATIRTQLLRVRNPQVLFEKGRSYLRYAAELGCDKAELQRLQTSIFQNQTDPDKLKENILEVLRLTEILYEPDSVSLPEVVVPVGWVVAPEMGIDTGIAGQTRRLISKIDLFKIKWNKRTTTTATREKKVASEYWKPLIKEAQGLVEEKYTVFHPTVFENLHLLDIIQLEEIEGLCDYIIIGTTVRGDYNVRPLESKKSRSVERTKLTRGYRGKITRLELKTPQEISGPREYQDIRREPPKDIRPYELATPAKVDSAA